MKRKTVDPLTAAVLEQRRLGYATYGQYMVGEGLYGNIPPRRPTNGHTQYGVRVCKFCGAQLTNTNSKYCNRQCYMDDIMRQKAKKEET